MFTSKEPDLESLKTLMEAAQMGWWKADYLTGKVMLCDYLTKFIGLDSPETTIAKLVSLVRPDYRKQIHTRFISLEEDNKFDETFPLMLTEGEVWIHMHLARKLSGDNSGFKLFGYTQRVLDIRNRHEGEILSLESRHQSLLREKQHMDDILNHLPVGYIHIRILYDEIGNPSDYRFLSINHMAQQALGVNAETYLGKTANELALPTQEHLAVLTPIRMGEYLETKWHEPSRNRYCRNFIYNTPNDESEIVILVLDVTKLKQTEQELIAAKVRAEEANKLKSAFIANISHEIRTPLNAIVGFSQLVAQEEQPQTREQYTEIINLNNDLLLQIITDVLDLSRIESGHIEIVNTLFDVSDLCREVVRTLHLQAQPEVVLQVAQNLPQLQICNYKQGLQQILANFTRNALKFTDKGSITIGFETRPEWLRFYVRDTGIGIPAEKLPHLFERFYKIDTFTQGTGLGLAICASIAEQLNGTIGVESTPGEGSTFWIEIPTAE